MRLLLSLSALVIAGCAAHIPIFPGPTSMIGRDAPLPIPRAPTKPAPAVRPPAPTSRAVTRPAHQRPSPLGPEIAAAAVYYLRHNPPSTFRTDCSGFVSAVLDRVEIPAAGGTTQLWEAAVRAGATHKELRPAPGDLAFFDNTYDANHNGQFDDELTHVGVVIEVDPHGVVVIAHGGNGRGRTELRMDPAHPHEQVDADGRRRNDPLRQARQGDPPGAAYLAGELWRGFARLHPDALEAWLH